MNTMFKELVAQAVTYLKEDLLPQLKEEVLPQIAEGAAKAGRELLTGIAKMFEEQTLSGSAKNIVVETFEMLNKERLIDVARNNTVKGANGVAAYMLEKDDMVYVYLVNVKDRELIPDNENKYVIIKAECVKNDVRALFGEEKLIILK